MLDFFKPKKQESKEPFQLSNLVEILQDGVCITNVNGEVIYLNKAAYSLLGLDRSEDLGQFNFFENFISEQEKIEYLKQEINQKGILRNYEMQLKKLSDSVLDVILTINLIGDFRNQTIGFLFLFKDITELKKIQEQLLQTQKLESIGLMASGIAHDFNNILAAIIPNAELIKISTEKSEQNFKRAEIIEKSAHRASDIAQRLLTFTRQSDQRNYTPINLNKIVEDTLEFVQHNIPKNVQISNTLAPDLEIISADATQMQQIVMNLVINAIDAMSDGGVISIKSENFMIRNYYQIGSLDPGEYVRVSIKDTGSGIPVEIVPKIFDPFFTTKEIGKGTGLGLSVVYGIVKGMDGHIEVDSVVNEGTRFDLYFPVDQEASEKVKQQERQSQVQPKDINLLIVDDEDYVLNILSDILEFLGYGVTKKGSGEEAVQLYKNGNQQFDYVILDLKMPKMDGRITSRELRKLNPKVKIIFTSGFDDQPLDDDDLAGVVGFLKKPYSINQIAKSLEEIFTDRGKKI